tara:strand:+ start:303 stop:1394 length:1092 start_codon:yes stop_codon:yes gene_type:complete
MKVTSLLCILLVCIPGVLAIDELLIQQWLNQEISNEEFFIVLREDIGEGPCLSYEMVQELSVNELLEEFYPSAIAVGNSIGVSGISVHDGIMLLLKDYNKKGFAFSLDGTFIRDLGSNIIAIDQDKIYYRKITSPREQIIVNDQFDHYESEYRFWVTDVDGNILDDRNFLYKERGSYGQNPPHYGMGKAIMPRFGVWQRLKEGDTYHWVQYDDEGNIVQEVSWNPLYSSYSEFKDVTSSLGERWVGEHVGERRRIYDQHLQTRSFRFQPDVPELSGAMSGGIMILHIDDSYVYVQGGRTMGQYKFFVVGMDGHVVGELTFNPPVGGVGSYDQKTMFIDNGVVYYVGPHTQESGRGVRTYVCSE